ncbi:sulfite exporter TauE/SafE family protein [Planctomycetota bacterium]
MLTVMLPVAGLEVNLLGVIILGAVVGILGGLLGVGGGFLITPMLNVLFGIPYNIAVGSDLSQMVGMSSSAATRHRKHGNLDILLGIIMILSACIGVVGGVSVMEFLKNAGTFTIFDSEVPKMTLIMSIIYISLLLFVGTSILKESIRMIRSPLPNDTQVSLGTFAMKLHRIQLPPMISLPASGVKQISLWILCGIGITIGFFCSLMGVGGGFIMTPCMIYIIGVPTTVAIGTSLFQIVFIAAFGTLLHSIKGNVDPILVLGLLIGSTIGSQIGATLTKKLAGAKLRLMLGSLLFIAVLFVAKKLYALIT